LEVGDDERTDGRTDDARQVEPTGVERDGVAEIVAPHQVDHQCLTSGDLDAGDGATIERQCDQRSHRYATGHGEVPEKDGFDAEQELRVRDELLLVGSVHEHAGVQRKDQNGKCSRRHDDTDDERAVGQLERQPAEGHGLHP
jgi:hypothetical protein